MRLRNIQRLQKGNMEIYLQEQNHVLLNLIVSGGGSFNYSGQRNGKLIELSEGFYNYSQVTQKDEYKKGKKVRNGIFFGKWILEISSIKKQEVTHMMMRWMEIQFKQEYGLSCAMIFTLICLAQNKQPVMVNIKWQKNWNMDGNRQKYLSKRNLI
ncbi:unnamed protein product [Paramecium primaurelia]|uniref:Uncharacterized protein n=1 Tax=Paramecium primaurelia TaxID=5886 RepID=A0A8S1KN58_PARPR|nr:unnamed protein product [Paramecium primaurelia]CAD8055911.1 unnamed protein product [Paramecium primaurelia]